MKKVYVNPLPVRIWHWINALGFIILIITGAQIRFADPMGLTSLRTAFELHKWIGLIVSANYLLWLIYYLSSGKLFKVYFSYLWKPAEFIKNSIKQGKYYSYGVMMGDKNPHHPTPEDKFNPLQQITYLIIMIVLLPLEIITGFMLWTPKFFGPLIDVLGGTYNVILIHVALGIFFTFFIFVHAYLGTLGNTPLEDYKAMITGYKEEYTEH